MSKLLETISNKMTNYVRTYKNRLQKINEIVAKTELTAKIPKMTAKTSKNNSQSEYSMVSELPQMISKLLENSSVSVRQSIGAKLTR